MSYAMHWLDGLGTPETDCRESGGLWDPYAERCEELSKRQCQSQGGRWDDAALMCSGLPGGPVSAADMCKRAGGRWDYDRRVCVPGSGTYNGGSTRGNARTSGKVPVPTAAVIGVAVVSVIGAIWWMKRRR